MQDATTLPEDEFLNISNHLKDEDNEDVFGPVPPTNNKPSLSIDPYVRGSGSEIKSNNF